MALVNAAIWQVRWKELYFGIGIASGQTIVIPANIGTLVVNFLRSILGSYLVQYTALWCVKFSFLFFFQGLGRNIKLQRIIWWCTLAFLITSYIICVATVDYRCLGSSFERSLGNATTLSLWSAHVPFTSHSNLLCAINDEVSIRNAQIDHRF